MQLSGLAQLIVITTQALFVQLIVNLKLCFPPLTFSFPAFSFTVFDRCGVSLWCFLFAQGSSFISLSTSLLLWELIKIPSVPLLPTHKPKTDLSDVICFIIDLLGNEK